MTNAQSMNGKRVLITGATNGIGEVTAVELAKAGADLTLVARSKDKADATLAKLRTAAPNANVEFLFGDLSVMSEVQRVANEFKRKHQRLHVLVNNAGATFSSRQVTSDGFEMTFALNHLGYFLLTRELLDVLKASAPARVVSVASEGHRLGRVDFDDLNSEKGSYKGVFVYSTSKLANILFANELARLLEGTGVTSNSVHPGVVNTGFAKNTPGWFNVAAKAISMFMLSAEKGAQTTLHVATAPELKDVTGKYFAKSRLKRPAGHALDAEVAKRLWAVSEELVNKALRTAPK